MDNKNQLDEIFKQDMSQEQYHLDQVAKNLSHKDMDRLEQTRKMFNEDVSSFLE